MPPSAIPSKKVVMSLSLLERAYFFLDFNLLVILLALCYSNLLCCSHSYSESNGLFQFSTSKQKAKVLVFNIPKIQVPFIPQISQS